MDRDMEQPPFYNGEKKSNPFKGTVHKVMLGLLILGIVAIIAVGIYIGIDLNRETQSGDKQTQDGGDTPGKSQCPDDDPTLIPWTPGEQETLDVIIDGVSWLLTENATVRTITITNGGKLVFADNGEAGDPITLRTRHILIQSNGELHVGSDTCQYMGYLTISLYGRLDDGEDDANPAFGRKFIGVAPLGSIEIHGAPRLAWTNLAATLQAGQTDPTITLAEGVTSWQNDYPQIVIASSDYDANHAEVFQTAPCDPAPCDPFHIKLTGVPQYTHFGEFEDSIDLRAEVGVLTRNVKIVGEVEDDCYGFPDLCPFFDVDLFGGQTQVLMGFTKAHFSDIELMNMGQQFLGAYPIHFHRSGEAYGSFARRLSIHDTRSRCVTIHSTNGLLVEDVVGYNAIGHCFFLEDGNEVNNTFRHNLGILTKPGSLLPHDRNTAMCEGLLDGTFGGYVPDAIKECRGASTFWITHPDNIVEDNVAAGSDEFGFFYIFHREPTGPSQGTLPPYHAERSPLAKFSNNKAHSNKRSGLTLDRGLKTTNADATDPREFLALIENGRYEPHQNRDLSLPRVPAIIDNFQSYKNFRGVDARGGDIYIEDSSFVDDTVGVTFLSDNTLPYDIGSHQEVSSSRFLGVSANFRGDTPHAYPQRAIEIKDGPVLVDGCTFTGYIADDNRNVSSAFGFSPNQQGQFSTASTVRGATFTDASLRLWSGEPGWVFGSFDSDGDQTQVLYDEDGSFVGTGAAYYVRTDQDLLNGADCVDEASYGMAACTSGDYGQVYLTASSTSLVLTVVARTGVTTTPFVLNGVNNDDGQTYTSKNYQPVLISGTDYNLHWDGVAPGQLFVSLHNFAQNGFVGLGLCYPSLTTFTVTYEEWDQLSDTVNLQEPMTAGGSLGDVDDDVTGRTYFWDETARLLYVKPVETLAQDGYNYCATNGCQRVNIQATIVNQDISDCRAP